MLKTPHAVTSRQEWLEARKALLAKEKEFTRLRDELSAERRSLPWHKIAKDYVFDGPDGRESLSDLFGEHHQLVVYHFMFAPGNEGPCKSCSFWADNFNGIIAHLAQRDVSFVAISRAPYAKLRDFARRMGWSFKWVSSGDTDFNYDFNVSFTDEQQANRSIPYNYATWSMASADMPGVSVFYRDGKGDIFHTYSAYARGLDILNTAYNYLDLVPKGRDEAELTHSMQWVRYRDEY